jgi:drug/metabolite transporter (DMT)-like permease
LFISFLIAAALSLIATLVAKKATDTNENKSSKKAFFITAGAGITFGAYNLLNTTLAGMLPSAVFFPVFNIGVIALTMICGIILLKERIRKKEILVLALGGMSILLLTVF